MIEAPPESHPVGQKEQPHRVCLVCRTERPRNELFRLVKQKEVAYFVPNPRGRLSGKGIYFCRNLGCIERLQKERKLKRLFLEKLQHGGLAWMQEQFEGLSSIQTLQATSQASREIDT